MRRPLAVLLVYVLVSVGCVSDRVTLKRGPLGPASYVVRLSIAGGAAIRAEAVEASLRVTETAEDTLLRLRVGDEDPVEAGLRRLPTGQVVLDTVEGVSPRSSGEADLASLVAQLDPPLPKRPVRMHDTWTSTRELSTETITAQLRTRMQMRGFRRSGGTDGVLLVGTVRGRVKTSASTGVFDGNVTGTIEAVWSIEAGRLVSSTTELTWRIPRLGRIVVRSAVRPA